MHVSKVANQNSAFNVPTIKFDCGESGEEQKSNSPETLLVTEDTAELALEAVELYLTPRRLVLVTATKEERNIFKYKTILCIRE